MSLSRNERIRILWTVGEDFNWLGKIFVYTIGLPFLIIWTICELLFIKD